MKKERPLILGQCINPPASAGFEKMRAFAMHEGSLRLRPNSMMRGGIF